LLIELKNKFSMTTKYNIYLPRKNLRKSLNQTKYLIAKKENKIENTIAIKTNVNRNVIVPVFKSPTFSNKELKLTSYQIEGVNWLLENWRKKESCIFADEMFLGRKVKNKFKKRYNV
jgi:SNF2 family DNA or RNA helicase